MTEPPAATTGFRRVLRTADIISIVVGCAIGTGIFFVPGQVAAGADAPWLVLGLWALGGGVCLLGALSVAELASALPGAGGVYSYLRAAFGDLAGFLYGWASLVVINAAVIGVLALTAAQYTAQLLALTDSQQRWVAAGFILAFAALNCLGLESGKRTQNVLTAVKLAGLGLVCAALCSAPVAAPALQTQPVETVGSVPSRMGGALVAVLWTFDGWAYAAFTGAEARHATRSIPRGLVMGVGLVTGVYLLVNLALLEVLGLQGLRASKEVTAAVAMAHGPASAQLVSALILVAVAGSLNGMFLSASRGLFALARDGLAAPAFSWLHPRFGTPMAAISLQAALGLFFLIFGAVYELLAITVAANWLFHAATALAVIVLRRRRPELERPFRAPGYPLAPLVFCAAALGIVLMAVVAEPWHAALGGALLAAGVPAFYLWRARLAARPMGASAGGG